MRPLLAALLVTVADSANAGPLELPFGEPTAVRPLGDWALAPWSVDAGWTAAVIADGCHPGPRCAKLTATRPDPPAVGTLRLRLDAAPYRGKRTRLRGALRAEVSRPFAGAGLTLRALRPDDSIAAGQRSAQAVSARSWTADEVVIDVPDDATQLELSLTAAGTGQCFFDALTLEAIGPAGAGNQPPRPLAGRGVDNLVAFARVYGYVRYFHASDQAAAADWVRVAIGGVRAVEGARDPAELAAALDGVFRPLAPSLEVFAGDRKPPAKPSEPPAGAHRVAWIHVGLGSEDPSSIYRSRRSRTDDRPDSAEAGLTRDLAAKPYRGGRVRLSAWVRTDVVASKGQARLYLGVRGEGGKDLFSDEMDDRPIVSPEWARFEIVAPVDATADWLMIGFELRGQGRAWVDDVKLEQIEPRPAPIPLPNAGFETADAERGPASWAFYENSPGYAAGLSPDRPHGGKRAGSLSWSPSEMSDPSRPFEADLGGGVSIRLPLAVYADGEGTLPRASGAAPPPAADVAGFVPSGDDRATRLADAIIAWNVFQHFYPYFDVVNTDWPAALRRALGTAATDKSASAFAITLKRMVAALHDGHGRVSFAGDPPLGFLPLAWAWIEGALVVTEVGADAGEGVRRGDAVRTLGGRPVAELIGEQEALISAATPGWARDRVLTELLGGPPGTPIELVLDRAGGGSHTVTLRYGKYGAQPVEEPRPDKIATLEPGIMYVDIGRITDEEFRAAVPRLAGARGIVFDLRGYPKGSPLPLSYLTSVPIRSSRWLVPAVSRPDRAGMTFIESGWDVKPATPRFRAKVAFLTDGRAISYAETYLGFVENYHLASIVGAQTAGTNGNINPFFLPGGYRIVWTGMKVLKRDRSRHHGVGILPTVPAAPTRAGAAAGKDEVLQAGVEVVKGKRKAR